MSETTHSMFLEKSLNIIKKNKKIIQVFIGILILILIFTKVNFIETIDVISSISIPFFLLSIITYLILNLSHAIRLKISLKSLNHDVSLRDSLWAQFFGMLFSDITPARVGYLSCAYPLKKKNKVPIAHTMSAIAIYQGIEFLLKGIQGFLSILFLLYFIGLSKEILYISAIALGFAIICGLGLLMMSSHKKFSKIFSIIKKTKTGKRILSFFNRFQKGSKKITKKTFIPIFFLTFIGWFIRATEWFLLGQAIGINLPWIICLFFHPIMSALTFVPVSPAGLGVYEGSIILLFSSLLSINPASALAFSLLDRVNNVIIDIFTIKEVFK